VALAMPAPDCIQTARRYWDHAAETYDHDFVNTLIGQTRREAVWRDLDRFFSAGDRLLELNCGTGIDAVHLASNGVEVVACDIAPRMIELARRHAAGAQLRERIDWRVLPTEEIGALFEEGPFDGVLSNFSGLNCVADIGAVARNLSRLLKPGGRVLASMMGRSVPWEFAWFLAHGEARKAMRRFGRAPVCHLDAGGLQIQCPRVKEIARQFAPEFALRGWKGIGILVPPSYMEAWARRFPRTTLALAGVDRWLARVPGVRGMADCVLLHFERVFSI
jgi:2-polyprenyl-3-methyl-5-hydroxy-6-metoxy-1,4-benzoquinol methylase